MDISEIQRLVAAWAATQPLVFKAWLFGSRVRGTERPDSDIDIAVEIRTLPGDSDPLVTFMFEADKLSASLQPLLPYHVHLQWYGGPTETPTIHAGLSQSSILVYEAN
ncbi:nucleotidyltransferase family protein [Cupriavidus basilensis]|uniref:nucleotidyltransferase family protein n=1 Tax=Cupriavidus basilensis TaxID=68895 RepID=UPI00157B5555|nr:nucleotidyltransferase domain-containing protein [Cupriavidus basilensis]